MKHALRLSDELVDEFLVADIYVKLLCIYSLMFLFDGLIELTEGISIHVFFHLPASVLFVVGSILFIPTDKNS